MKKSLFYVLAILLSVNAVQANTDKTKTELRDAIYANCTKEIKTNNKINADIKNSTTMQAKVCSCVADNTIQAIDSASLKAFSDGGWNAYQEQIKGKTEISKITDRCITNSAGVNKNLLTKEMFDKYIKKMQEAKKNGTSGKTNSGISNEGLLKLLKNNSGKVSLKELLQKKAQ